MIFVFGSNLSGIHDAGAAHFAWKNKGAKWEVGEGLAGDSYALPTKGLNISYMPLPKVKEHIKVFLDFAEANPQMTFQVTRVGCGLAGWKDSQIAPLFMQAPKNCQFDEYWRKYLGDNKQYWGTF